MIPTNTTNAARLIHPVLIVLTLFASCGKNNSEIASTTPPPATRIISFAPSVTEILYELGLGDRVCGVTQFCNYPPEAAQKEKIGGQADRNYEAVVRLKPDLAVILKEQRDMIAFLDKYSIRYITVGSDSVDEILESIRMVANACSVADKGRVVVEGLRKRMESVSASVYTDNVVVPSTEPTKTGERSSPLQVDSQMCCRGELCSPVVSNGTMFNRHFINNNDKPKVLLCVSRDAIGSGAIGKCFVAGGASFYDRLIDAAGGVNVMGEVKQAYPTITAEAVIRLAPDVIIDLSMSYTDNHQQQQKICGDWTALKSVPAVKAGKVRCLSGDYLTIPGPRVVLILEDIRNAIYQR